MKHDLIVTIVNRGFADDVMQAAHRAGAYGGTVLNARGSDIQSEKKLFGAVIEPEKEMVLILVEHGQRTPVMEAIAADAGLTKDSMGICFSLPVDAVKGISRFEQAEKTE